ncbi:hypothetical protein POJ06DRAFT_200727 [Lipomyces tetrasporus]|uniref:HMA domain-containing protein n=1 Tax=Lipomyces tetrasporus TaxID=54092 RepID=A0AAD7QN66_9ASCO|nr:uncharacterized protein POJ06DRAFT_200727 [Lipomyces tetrasporus]KAJ8098293.1 hypothetical protein POJ06DRAFT_200727 [Lipomyces tetrasporus]
MDTEKAAFDAGPAEPVTRTNDKESRPSNYRDHWERKACDNARPGEGDCCSKESDECCRSEGECGRQEEDGCCDSSGNFSDDDDACGKGDHVDRLGDRSCCEANQKGRVDAHDGQEHPISQTAQVERSIVHIKRCECDDDGQTIRSSSDAESLVTCCIPSTDAPLNHTILRIRPSSGKKKDKDCCDDQCVRLLAKALCEKECHKETGDVCVAHESVANHYSSFLKEKRELLWRCICSLKRQLEVPGACCTNNIDTLSTGPGYPFLYPPSAITAATSQGHNRLRRRHRHSHARAQHSHEHGHDHACEHEKEVSNRLFGSSVAPDHDPESGLVPEKLSMSIKGMNCSSCEKKAARSFERIMGVTNVSVNFLFEKGQLEYYPTLTSPKQICADLQRMTGFKASIIRTDDDAFYFISGKECAGDGVEKLPDNSWKVVYDPNSVGARDKMTSLGLEVSDILPSLRPDDVTRTMFGMTHDIETMQQYSSFLVSLILTIPILVLSWGSFKPSMGLTRSVVCLVLATIIQIVCARKIYMSVCYTIAHGYDLDSDCLVALSTSVAYLYSVIIFGLHRHGILLSEDEVYESSSLLLTLVLFGKLITTFIRRLAADQVKFDVFQPTTAKLEQFGNAKIPASLLQYDDHIVLDAGDQAVTDGIVVSGQGEFEESHINGESIPRLKKRGQEVLAGANLVSGSVVFRATRLVPENSVSNIKSLVDSVTSFRTRTSDIVELVAKYLVPVMICVSCIVFMIWTLVGTQVRHQSAGVAASTAITYSVGTLAVSCPCALVLVIPLVLSMGVAAGKRSYGILLKSAGPTTIASKVKHVVFDKTGTLTSDELSVQYCWFNEETEYPVRDIIRAIVSENRHPISRAVGAFLNKFGDTMAKVGETENIIGSGMKTTYKPETGKSVTILCGKPAFVGISSDETRVAQLCDSGLTLFCVAAKDGPILCIMGISSTIRDSCRPVLDILHARGITVHVLSGDTRPAVEKLCRDLGISHYQAETSPEGKNEYIESLKSSGSKVLFCGDGANDAIALAQADIGVSMTTDGITLAAADACILSGEVAGVVKLLDLSNQINHRVIIGVAWACIYNLFAVLIVSGAFVKVRIGPGWAGVSEVISIVPVFAIAISLKLTGWRKK